MNKQKAIGSTAVEQYFELTANSKISLRNIFQMLSIEMSGDGDTIKKHNLITYLGNIEDGDTIIEISENAKMALNGLLRQWDKISHSKDYITYESLGDYPEILLATIAAENSIKEDVDLLLGYVPNS